MLTKINLLLVLALITMVTVGYSQPPQKMPTCAVMDFNVRTGLTAGDALTLTDAFRSSLANAKKFRLVTRDKMKEVFEANDFNESCASSECAAKALQLLQTDKLIFGDLGKIGGTYTINIQMIDGHTGEIEKSLSEKYKGEQEGLLETAEVLAQKLAGTYKEKGSKTWWYIGGAALAGGGAAAYILMQPKKTEKAEGLPLPPDPPNQ